MLNNQRRYMFIVVTMCIIVSLSACVKGSPLVTGRWEGDIFTNEWTDITFKLPQGFQSMPRENSPRGQVADFTLVTEEFDLVISLAYYDVSSGEAGEHTAEDYLNISKEQLTGSQKREYTFQEDLEQAVIAGEEYTVMRTEFVNYDDPTKVVFQDAYARRWVDTMVVFLVVYTEDTKDLGDSFLNSISKVE